MYLVVKSQSSPVSIGELNRTEIGVRQVGEDDENEFIVEGGVKCEGYESVCASVRFE
jgi:hypothetical protein